MNYLVNMIFLTVCPRPPYQIGFEATGAFFVMIWCWSQKSLKLLRFCEPDKVSASQMRKLS